MPRKVGRPTKYTPELIDDCYDYLERHEELGDVAPIHVGLFLHVGINPTAGYRWAEEEGKEQFKDILETCKTMQHRVLASSGLDGSFNPTITKLFLTKHGYSDKEQPEASESENDKLIAALTAFAVAMKDN